MGVWAEGSNAIADCDVNLHSDALMTEGCAGLACWDVAVEDVGVCSADCGIDDLVGLVSHWERAW